MSIFKTIEQCEKIFTSKKLQVGGGGGGGLEKWISKICTKGWYLLRLFFIFPQRLSFHFPTPSEDNKTRQFACYKGCENLFNFSRGHFTMQFLSVKAILNRISIIEF